MYHMQNQPHPRAERLALQGCQFPKRDTLDSKSFNRNMRKEVRGHFRTHYTSIRFDSQGVSEKSDRLVLDTFITPTVRQKAASTRSFWDSLLDDGEEEDSPSSPRSQVHPSSPTLLLRHSCRHLLSQKLAQEGDAQQREGKVNRQERQILAPLHSSILEQALLDAWKLCVRICWLAL